MNTLYNNIQQSYNTLISSQQISIYITSLIILISLLYYYIKPNDYRTIKPTLPFNNNATTTYQHGTGRLMNCTNPATGQHICDINEYTNDDVKQAAIRCRQAQQLYKNTTWPERQALLQSFIDYIVDNQDEIVELSCIATGKSVTEAAVGEIVTTVEKLRWLMHNGPKYLQRDKRQVPFLLSFTKSAYVDYYPYGVIGIIVPWNYPFHNVISHLATCIITGNGALIKVSDYTSHTKLYFDKLFSKLLSQRNIPIDLYQVATGGAITGQALIEYTDKILFIGSPGVGQSVMTHAAKYLKPVILELGGKDPFIVFNDADIEQCIDIAFTGAFINCGQNCISAERFYVQANVYDKFIEQVNKRIKRIRQGPPIIDNQYTSNDIGAITMSSQINKYNELIQDAISNGAKLLHGGKQCTTQQCKNGSFYELTVIADCTNDMNIVQEEVFGPCMTIIKFNDQHELINMVNNNKYGLGSSVFTCDLEKAQHIASQLEVGMCNINDFASVPLISSLPFGGLKHSGFDCFNGIEGLRGFCRRQAVVIDRWPGVRTKLPEFMKYPFHKHTPYIARNAVKLIYGRSVIDSVKALINIVRLVNDK